MSECVCQLITYKWLGSSFIISLENTLPVLLAQSSEITSNNRAGNTMVRMQRRNSGQCSCYSGTVSKARTPFTSICVQRASSN